MDKLMDLIPRANVTELHNIYANLNWFIALKKYIFY